MLPFSLASGDEIELLLPLALWHLVDSKQGGCLRDFYWHTKTSVCKGCTQKIKATAAWPRHVVLLMQTSEGTKCQKRSSRIVLLLSPPWSLLFAKPCSGPDPVHVRVYAGTLGIFMGSKMPPWNVTENHNKILRRRKNSNLFLSMVTSI